MRKHTTLYSLIILGLLSACSRDGSTPNQAQTANRNDVGIHAGGMEVADVASQIVKGQVSARGARPYQVALTTSRGSSFCGGTLIAANWVLTAAHCVSRRSSVYVRVGANRLSDRSQGESIRSAGVYNHPSYRSVGAGYDIALIKLSRNARLDSYTRPASLPSNSVESILDRAGKTAVVSGWGDLYSGARRGSDVLREVEIPITPDPRRCGSNGALPRNVICGNYYQGKDSCQGDSGGPLAQSYNGRFYVLGVVSYGRGCSGDGVYTRVNAYLSWIQQVSGVVANAGGNTGGGNTGGNTGGGAPRPTSQIVYSTTFNKGEYKFAPLRGFRFAGGALKAELKGDHSADFDLYLEKYNGSTWTTVARSTTYFRSDEVLQYQAAAGTYRWKVRAWEGGGYVTLTQTPRGSGQ